jgi:hypothetical protein
MSDQINALSSQYLGMHIALLYNGRLEKLARGDNTLSYASGDNTERGAQTGETPKSKLKVITP